jgi:hypothetical protein
MVAKVEENDGDDMKNRIKELERQILTLKKPLRISDLALPTNDYMKWVVTLVVNLSDKMDAFNEGSFVVIKRIMRRNRIENSGVFCRFIAKSGGRRRLLVGRKILGANCVILGYRWDYVKMEDYVKMVEYFCDIFKREFIMWMGDGGGSQYELYYNNVMLINENVIVRQLKEFIVGCV